MPEEKEIKEIKKAIQYLKIARRSDYVTFHAMIDGETFNEKVIKPLEKLSQWKEEDEKSIIELAEKFRKETEGKTVKEKSEKIKKILKIGAVGGEIAVGIGAISAVTVHLLKKVKNK